MKVTDINTYRMQRGRVAKAAGNHFEQLFEVMCERNKLCVTRFPDGCKRVSAKQLVQVKTPWDWIVTHRGTTAFIDTKTSCELSFPHSKITEHQILEMIRHELHGAIAGYVIWLRKANVVVFVPASELLKLAREKGSIQFGQRHVLLLGTPNYFDVRILFRKDSNLDPKDAG
jgi:hypothetical protein